MILFSKFVIFLLSPLGTALCLAVLAFALAGLQHRRTAHGFAACALVWLWVWSTPVCSLWLRSVIEDAQVQQPITAMPQAQAIVVLGGALSPPSGPSSEIDLQAAADRVWYAARLFHARKAPLLLLSGGSDRERHAYSEAQAMAVFLQDLGVPRQAMWLEEASRTTRENAALSAPLLKAQGIQHILLITSAMHMPRAMALFAAQGLHVHPAPTDFEANHAPPAGLQGWFPEALALDGSGRAIKELVGKWIGW